MTSLLVGGKELKVAMNKYISNDWAERFRVFSLGELELIFLNDLSAFYITCCSIQFQLHRILLLHMQNVISPIYRSDKE